MPGHPYNAQNYASIIYKPLLVFPRIGSKSSFSAIRYPYNAQVQSGPSHMPYTHTSK